MRQLKGWTREDLLNEGRAIDKVFSQGSSENLVAVLRHGWLAPNSPFYHIDMEMCNGNLEDYMQGRKPERFCITANPRLLGATFNDIAILNVWDIMEQIASGLEFIHRCHEVHRDLKPQNGNSYAE